MFAKLVFIAGLILACSGFISPPIALVMGLLFGLTLAHPYSKLSRKWSKYLLQASVVGLGFGMDLQQVVHAGRSGFMYTALGIAFAMIVGMGLGRAFAVERISAFLISTGTAICGGSAIAAVGPISNASDEQMAVSLGTVFLLNSVALLTFPQIGNALKLSQNQFGLWAALAIHDSSSVVGAAAKFGTAALTVATTVKLARALWIVPMSLGTAAVMRSNAKIQWPWFIGLFVLAAVLNTYFPAGAPAYHLLSAAARIGLTVTLYLIGSGLSVATIKKVGPRPLLQGVLLWILVAAGSLWLIRLGWISI